MTGPKMKPLDERFFSKVRMTDGCWIWTAAKANGYGKLAIGWRKPPKLAHRIAYEQIVGPIPEGLTLDHLCRNRACVRPEHLEAVTHRENVLRGESPSARQARMEYCARGHLLADGKIEKDGKRRCVACRRLVRSRKENREKARQYMRDKRARLRKSA